MCVCARACAKFVDDFHYAGNFVHGICRRCIILKSLGGGMEMGFVCKGYSCLRLFVHKLDVKRARE